MVIAWWVESKPASDLLHFALLFVKNAQVHVYVWDLYWAGDNEAVSVVNMIVKTKEKGRNHERAPIGCVVILLVYLFANA